MFNLNYFSNGTDVKSFFRGYGSFGEIHGELQRDGQTIYQETKDYRIQCEYVQDDYGVFTRNDTFENVSEGPINVKCLKSRFIFEGGEYQVYTQYNGWQHESSGAWQPLVTSVGINGASTRLTEHATPFMVLWSDQAGRGVAFHLIPGSAWEMKVSRVHSECKYTKIVVELGISDYNMDIALAPGEKINMPQILCYEIRSKLDMDCYKLHNYMHTNYPRKAMPMLYNTWMCRFDNINYEVLAKQAELAARLGLEYFIIDAGWFGKGASWGASVGDWEENTTSALCGRMIDVADKVRSLGMKFGLWLEPERAVPTADSVREHPEYFLKGDVEEFYFFDFSNQEAREWMLNIIFGLIDHYGIEYIKDDYNANLYFDVYHTAFLKYHEGHAKFIKAIRDRYPDLYITNCGSGGERMDLGSYMKFDSAWPSDNESPYVEMRMYRDTILRMPPQGFERWIAVHSIDTYKDFYKSFEGSNKGNLERMVACGDAVWHNIVGVQQSFMEGYMTCGPVGFSCDLTLMSEKAMSDFKARIDRIKEEREFWKTAVARILTDTESVTTYQYSDMGLNKIVVQIFTHITKQDHFRAYPVLDETRNYRLADGQILSGKIIADEGIELVTEPWQDNWHEMLELRLEAV